MHKVDAALGTNRESLQGKILVEQVKVLYESMTSLLLINLLVSASLCYALWDLVPHAVLTTWMGLMLAMIGVRGAIYYRYRKQFVPDLVERYGLFLVLGSASAGLIWGMAGVFLFVPDRLDYQLFVLLCLFAMSGGSTFSLSNYLPAYYAFAPLTLLPVTIQLLLHGGSIHTALAASTFIFLAAMTSFNIKINRNFKLSHQLRFENLELIEQLQQQKAEAERANRAKSKFLAAASHDLRQPLYALSLFSSVLEELDKEPEAVRAVEQIKKSVSSLQILFDALLDISKLDAGVIVPERTNFRMQPVLQRLRHDFEPQAHDAGIQLIFEDCSDTVYSEPALLDRILRNFVSNAIRYTPDGSVTISCETSDTSTCIRVTDTGPGIPLESQEEIFQEFHQLENPERDRGKGLGLGLSIAKRAANLLEHPIQVDSRPGRGSTFSVSVPIAQDQPDAQTVHNPARSSQGDHNLLVLVMDDEQAILDGTTALLEMWGCRVIAHTSCEEALNDLTSSGHSPDAIISDYFLSDGQNGIESIGKVRQLLQREVPSLLVTGDIDKERLREFDDSGLSVLYKPVAPAKLRAFLRGAEAQKMHSTQTT